MKKSFYVLSVCIMAVISLLASCTTTQEFSLTRDGDYPQGTYLANPKILPDWASSGMFFNNAKLYITGSAETSIDAAMARRKAQEDALGQLTEYIGSDVAKRSISTTSMNTLNEGGDISQSSSDDYVSELSLYAENRLLKTRPVEYCSYERRGADGNPVYGAYVLMVIDSHEMVAEAGSSSLEKDVLEEVSERIEHSLDLDEINLMLDIRELLLRN